MKSLSEAKVRYSYQKIRNEKFHFIPGFWGILRFYQQFHCNIYVWRLCEPNLIFFLIISITLSFQIKKIQIPKILSTWIFVAQSVNKILRSCSWYGICLRCLIFAQTIVFHQHCMKITSLISIWLQLSHNGSSKLFKIFIKSILLAILSCHDGFFKKDEIVIVSVNLCNFIEYYEPRKDEVPT